MVAHLLMILCLIAQAQENGAHFDRTVEASNENAAEAFIPENDGFAASSSVSIGVLVSPPVEVPAIPPRPTMTPESSRSEQPPWPSMEMGQILERLSPENAVATSPEVINLKTYRRRRSFTMVQEEPPEPPIRGRAYRPAVPARLGVDIR